MNVTSTQRLKTNIDFRRWAEVYEHKYGECIEYRDSRRRVLEEVSPRFESLSKEVIHRGYLFREEFINICKWKTSRPLPHYRKNSESQVRHLTTELVKLHPDIEAQLVLLMGTKRPKGVGMAVASALLTVLFPSDYCVIDYRARRCLYWLQNGPSCTNTYRGFAATHDFLSQDLSPSIYLRYLGDVTGLAKTRRMTPRQIEMALWQYDKDGGVIAEKNDSARHKRGTK